MPIRTIRSLLAGRTANTAAKTTTVAEAAALMRSRRVGSLLVCDGPKLIGIFTERDALYRVLGQGLDPATTALEHVMTPQPQTINPDEPFRRALQIMYEGGFRHLPVVEFGRPLGMVSVRDALDEDLYEMHLALEQRETMRE